MTGRVVVTQPMVPGSLTPLSDAGLSIELLSADGPPTHDELCRAVAGADALVCLLTDVVDDAVFVAGAPSLRVVANVAVGLDNLDLGAAARHDVTVTHTPGVLDAATADLAMTLLLNVSRRILEGEALIRSGEWTGFSTAASLGRDLKGMRLGLVGYGRIARRVAARAQAFEMVVTHHARHPTGVPGYVEDLDQLVGQVDAVSLHVPLTPATRHLLDARRLALLPHGALVINTARGPVLDEVALVAGLRAGRLGGAGLDVFDNEPHVRRELLDAPNVVLTPHIGSATVETRQAMAQMAVGDVVALLAGRDSPNVAHPESTRGDQH